MNIRHSSQSGATRRISFLPLILAIIIGLSSQSCSPDDYYRDDTINNLTSATWFAEVTFPDRYSSEYWDFYPDGTGDYELYTEYPDGYYEDLTYPFVWEFTDPSFSTIAINVQGYGWEYWTIDHLSPDQFGVYISDSDPSYYPDVDTYYQRFYAI